MGSGFVVFVVVVAWLGSVAFLAFWVSLVTFGLSSRFWLGCGFGLEGD